jgi:hypothetical protein
LYNVLVVCLQERELQLWCPAPLSEGEQHWRKLRSDKYKPPAGRLLEFYESYSSVEADEDTGDEAGGGGVGIGPDAGGAAKPQRRTRSAVGKQSVSAAAAAAAAVSAVKATEKKKKKRKRRVTSPPVVVTPTIPTPRSREVESEEEEEESEKEKEKDEAIEELPVAEDRPARRSESPAAKRQRELVEKTSEDALLRGLETQRAAATTWARMPAGIKPRPFGPKLRIPTSAR